MRVFVAIDIPTELYKEIKKVQENLPNFIGKKIVPRNLHLTLKFIGEIDEKKVEQVKQRLREIKLDKFETEIDKIGIFSPDFIRIVWLHISGCEEIQKEVDEKLSELFEKERRFMSHLTIARVKGVRDREKFIRDIKNIKLPKIKFKVKKFKLKESILKFEGPEYKDLEVYDL